MLNFPHALKQFGSLAKTVRSLRVYKSGPGTQAAVAASLLAQGRNVVIVTSGVRELQQLHALTVMQTAQGDTDFPKNRWIEFPSYSPQSSDNVRWAARWAALYGLVSGTGPRGVLLTADNLLPKWPNPSVLDGHHLSLNKGEELLAELLLEQCSEWGYERVRLVTRPGEMAMRGDILDIFGPGYAHPLRLEFFGDVLEDLRLFDQNTQRSRQELVEAVILPVTPAILTPELTESATAKWEAMKTVGELSAQGLDGLGRRVEAMDGGILPGLFYQEPVSLGQWLPKDAVVLLCGAGSLRSKVEEAKWAWNARLEDEADQQGWKYPETVVLESAERARSIWMDRDQIHFEDLTLGEKRDGVDLPEKALHGYDDLFWKPEDRNRPWQSLLQALQRWDRERPQTLLSFRNERSRRKFMTLAAQEGVVPRTDYDPEARGLYALISPLRGGVELGWNQTLVLSEDILQPEVRRVGASDSERDFKGMKTYDDLAVGDLLVHRDWGLARFGGLHRLEMGAVGNDYLLLTYSGDDKLYLPVDRLNLIQRFKGPEGATPVLDKLGGAGWSRAKSRARKAIEKIAQDLVEMYAYRRIAKGYAYGPPDDMFAEFEASFGFEETPDQDKAIRDVLRDMEREEPMDRLVCGDVGFGKTEIAMRASFRAALAGRQVALVCPTTVLAEQHYQNFKRRLEGFPVNVAMLSRFVPRARQKAVLTAAARGQVDILIGTHRLFSKDVDLPNLGLLILDEEQRFGVKHKERLKELRKNIDVLALSATPIPRTLQLSLSGVRKLSVMETPPLDRKPVRTSILEREEGPLRAIVEREMERGGQVFWVHNRVQSLPRVKEFVQKLVPEARVGMAHGQMRERELEDTIHGFWHGELDVLVCTAIIESGLDFPRANTLVVDQAQLFGLGQLYQLRGRVGRSTRQAYAYFVVPDLDRLPEPSRKRLQVILDMDYLGAGFQVAMEDLRLRGAGNILGKVQSGTMAKVGLDLYLEMLEEEVCRLRGEGLSRETSPELNIVFEAHIPEDFIPEARERLRYYKALSTARDGRVLDELVEELHDRFGTLPSELERFLAMLRLKRFLGRLQVEKADVAAERIVLSWAEEAAPAPETLVAWVQEREGRARLLPPGRLELRVESDGSIREALHSMEKELTGLMVGATTP